MFIFTGSNEALNFVLEYQDHDMINDSANDTFNIPLLHKDGNKRKYVLYHHNKTKKEFVIVCFVTPMIHVSY